MTYMNNDCLVKEDNDLNDCLQKQPLPGCGPGCAGSGGTGLHVERVSF